MTEVSGEALVMSRITSLHCWAIHSPDLMSPMASIICRMSAVVFKGFYSKGFYKGFYSKRQLCSRGCTPARTLPCHQCSVWPRIQPGGHRARLDCSSGGCPGALFFAAGVPVKVLILSGGVRFNFPLCARIHHTPTC